MNFKEIRKHKVKLINSLEAKFEYKMFSSVALISDWKPVTSRSSVLLKVIPKPSPTDEQTVAKRDLETSGYSDHHQERRD